MRPLLPDMAQVLADDSRDPERRRRLAIAFTKMGFDALGPLASLAPADGPAVPLERSPTVSTGRPLAYPGFRRMPYGVGRRVKEQLERVGLKIVCGLCQATNEKMDRLSPEACREQVLTLAREMRRNAERLRSDTKNVSWWQRAGIRLGIAVFGTDDAEAIAAQMILAACVAEQEYLAKPVTWFVGVRTAPRRVSTLLQSVASIVAAGWTPTIFAEPGTDLSGLERFPIVQRTERLGVWGNWRDILERAAASDAEQVLTCEDDAVVVPGAREFVEASGILAQPRVGFTSLYTSKAHHQASQGWHTVDTSKWGCFWGSVAMVMPRHSVEQIVQHRIAQDWRGIRGDQVAPDVWGGDVAVTRIVRALKLNMWAHSPSLCQHIGETSTIPGHAGATGNRRATAIAALTPEDSARNNGRSGEENP